MDNLDFQFEFESEFYPIPYPTFPQGEWGRVGEGEIWILPG